MATTRAFGFDGRRRLRTLQTYRTPPSIWTSTSTYSPAPSFGGSPSSFQLILTDLAIEYDAVDNPISIRDYRDPAEWSPGAKPVQRRMQYDDLYRLRRADYAYALGTDAWVAPFAHENTTTTPDPRLGKPSPQVSFDRRILFESYTYDWLGNTTASSDDAQGFFDRSLGTLTNGTASDGPYQLRGATNEAGTGTRTGRLSTKYDAAGNLVALAVRRNGPCLPSGATCSQRFHYDWDEVGNLFRARRWDLSEPGTADGAVPTTSTAAELRYNYNYAGGRTLKTAVDAAGAERHTAYVFATLELRRAAWTGSDYVRNAYTEVPYLFGNASRVARVVYADPDVPSASLLQPRLHIFFELGDQLGSTSLVIDKDTSELVEQGTYRAYGGADADYRSARWKGFREDYRFTGKEEDVEVGLAYFGARYLSPAIGRWISADPLAIHSAGADLNAYAYVSGRAFAATDPLGLQGKAVDGSGSMEHTAPPKTDVDVQPNGDVHIWEWSQTPSNGGASQANLQRRFDREQDLYVRSTMNAAASKGIGGQTVTPFEQAAKNWDSVGRNEAIDRARLNELVDFASGLVHMADTVGTGGLLGSSIDGVAKGLKAPVPTNPYAKQVYEKESFEFGLFLLGASIVLPEVAGSVGGSLLEARTLRAGSECPCFVAGTPVSTPEGLQPIEAVRAGDEVWASDDGGRTSVRRRVLRTFVHRDEAILRLDISTSGNTESFQVTAGHPFFRLGDGWQPVIGLRVGDRLVHAGGGTSEVLAIEKLARSTYVYNIEVEYSHDYFVGVSSQLVHNACCSPTTTVSGEFSVVDWTGYPSGAPRPTGPFRLLEGAEYDAARKAATNANRALHRADPAKYGGLDIHEIQPVKFNGSPTDLANKIPLTRQNHAPFTNFWNKLMDDLYR